MLPRLTAKHTRMVGFYSEVYFDCSQDTGPSLVGSRKLTFLGLNENIDPILLSAVTNYFLTAFGTMGKHTGATRQLCGVGSLLLPLRVLEIDMQQVLSSDKPPYQLLEMFPIKKRQSESTFVNIYSLELKKACISTLYSLAKLHRN